MSLSMEDLGEKLRIARKQNGATQEMLANAIRMNVRTLRRAERGIMGPKTLNRIAKGLGLEVIVLLELKRD